MNELLKSILWCGIKFMSLQPSDGLSRFKVGGKAPSLSEIIEKIASIAPDAPNKCPVEDFVDDIKILSKFFSKSFFTALYSISSPSGVEVPCAFM